MEEELFENKMWKSRMVTVGGVGTVLRSFPRILEPIGILLGLALSVEEAKATPAETRTPCWW